MASRVELITWNDLIEHLIDWMGANPTGEARRDAKRASYNAVRDVANCYSWAYYYTRGQFATNAAYSTGTVDYDHTGGSSERLVTLTDGTFPSWANLGWININDTVYEVASYIDSTHITLSVNSNPGQDVTGSSFTLFRDEYPMPCNFQSMGEVILATFARVLEFSHPSTLLSRRRIWRGTATPHSYSINGSADFQNTMSFTVYPPPDNSYTVQYLFKRRPRPLKIDLKSDGTVSVSASGLSVTGTGTAFDQSMVGSTIRLGTTAQLPTSRWGNYPFTQERVITAVGSATSLTIDSAWDSGATSVKYVISDPVDIDVGSMLSFLLRKAELNTGHARNKRDREQLEQICQREEIRAREQDARSFKEEAIGRTGVWPTRLADFPFVNTA